MGDAVCDFDACHVACDDAFDDVLEGEDVATHACYHNQASDGDDEQGWGVMGIMQVSRMIGIPDDGDAVVAVADDGDDDGDDKLSLPSSSPSSLSKTRVFRPT